MDTVYVVGAGPGGLAAAAALQARGFAVTVLERDSVAASWRRHYERLHLHTTRRFSGLPGLAIPRAYGRWVARADVVRYLETYSARHGLDVETGVEVTRVDPDPARAGGWLLRTASGEERRARAVVVATGYNHTPLAPDWPGRDGFTGELVHASAYRDAAPYADRDVLVVGVGNTGAEIAVDLVDGGAARVRLAVRTPPHIVRRSQGPWAGQYTGILVRRLPVRLVDRMAGPVRRASVPDLAHVGLPVPAEGLYTRVKQGSIPVQDVGLVDAVLAGRVEVVPAVTGFDGDAVLLADGSRATPDVVLAATGYARGLEPLVGHLGVLSDRGVPVATGGRPAVPGLFFTGYTNPISGMFREMAIDARRIARALARG